MPVSPVTLIEHKTNVDHLHRAPDPPGPVSPATHPQVAIDPATETTEPLTDSIQREHATVGVDAEGRVRAYVAAVEGGEEGVGGEECGGDGGVGEVGGGEYGVGRGD